LITQSFAQSVEYFKGKQFVLIDSAWHIYLDQGAQRFEKIDQEYLSVKLKPDYRTTVDAQQLATDLNITFVDLNILGWATYYINDYANYFTIVKYITVSPSHTESNINVSDINAGTYTVLLLANGKVLDTANLIKQ
jgi:hypothetical protein